MAIETAGGIPRRRACGRYEREGRRKVACWPMFLRMSADSDPSAAKSEMETEFGPLPSSFTIGDGIDWSSPLVETTLYVELPFWMMTPPGRVNVQLFGSAFTVDVCLPWIELFGGEVLDSRASCVYRGPWQPNGDGPLRNQIVELTRKRVPSMLRHCKTVLRLHARAHSGAFRQITDTDPPRVRRELETYWASLCDAHLPVVNELIQRYRLVTYDYFAYEVSAWDVPVWFLKHAEALYRVVLVPYKSWDDKPTISEGRKSTNDEPESRLLEYATLPELATASSKDAAPGEFDLLDARSLMERGDYTGAVRRTVTAIEAVLASALLGELTKKYGPVEAAPRLEKTAFDFPGRLRQWCKIAQTEISEQDFDRLEQTRKVRHEIVHRSRRLVHEDRGIAQHAVDTGRRLYNKIEGKPDRAKLRDTGALKSLGRVALALRYPAILNADGITVTRLPGPPGASMG